MSQEIRYATCALDCPSACALEVTVENNALVKVRGFPDHPFTRGIICSKVARFGELQNGPRILEPLIRTGPKGKAEFRAATWDEALEFAATRLTAAAREHGPASVLPFYYGGNQGLVQGRAIERLARVLGYRLPGRTLCFANATAGWTAGVGALLGPDPLEVEGSDLILLWGINAASTHLHFWDLAKRARKKGARLVAIDPFRTRTARGADLHLPLRPGTDGALACAMMQVLLAEGLADRDYLAAMSDFDPKLDHHLESRTPQWAAPICGLAASQIRDLALAYGRAERPFIRVGVGMTRQHNGAVNVHAVSCLPAVVGAWPKKSAGALLATNAAFDINDEPVRLEGQYPAVPRVLDMGQLGRDLTAPDLSPKVAALLVFNANPAVTCPDLGRVHQGLRRQDLFTMVHEIVLSDTARFADVVLPAPTFLEQTDLFRSYGQYTLQLVDAALPPAGQARCNHDLVNDLAARLGVKDPAFVGDSHAMLDRLLAASHLPARAAWQGQRWLDKTPAFEVGHFRRGFPTSDGRFHFYPEWPDQDAPQQPDHWPVNSRDGAAAGDFPLDFITPPAHEVLNSTFTGTDQARTRRLPPRLLLHPEDAKERDIVSGEGVTVKSPRGQLTLVAEISDQVRPGMCACESNYSGWSFPEQVSLNALVADNSHSPAPGPAYHDTRVEVAKAFGTSRPGKQRSA